MARPGLRPVVVGTDGSADSRTALEWAACEAQRRHAKLRVVHAYVPPAPYVTFGYSAYEQELQVPLRQARILLDETADQVGAAHPRLSVDRALVVGGPAGVLVDESHAASVVVVGARGQGGFAGLLGGSVATQLAAHAHSPVVVVRHGGEDPEETSGTGLPAGVAIPDGSVVVGVDGSEQSTTALGFAFELASGRDLPLVAVYAWRGLPTANLGPVTVWHYNPDDARNEAARLLAEQLAGWSDTYPDVRVQRLAVLSFNPAETLLAIARTATLLVVGTRGRGGFAGLLLGSVSHTLMQHAHVPVAVVHPNAPLT